MTEGIQSRVEDVSEDYTSGSDSASEDAPLSLRSDALDEEPDDAVKTETGKRKRRRAAVASSSKRTQSSKHKLARSTDPKSKKNPSEKRTPAKKKLKVVVEERDSDVELKDGQEVVGKVVEAPVTGWGTHTFVPSRTRFTTHEPLDSAGRSDISTHTGFPDALARPSMQ